MIRLGTAPLSTKFLAVAVLLGALAGCAAPPCKDDSGRFRCDPSTTSLGPQSADLGPPALGLP